MRDPRMPLAHDSPLLQLGSSHVRCTFDEIYHPLASRGALHQSMDACWLQHVF
jgi:hypothetical protein